MILIVGYGNGLRSDDAIGHILGRAMGQRFNQDVDLRVYQLHQLTPELVEQISEASHVIFIDARADGQVGTVICETVCPHVNDGAFTHKVSPANLFGTALDWYGAAPKGLLISVVGASFEYGDKLSPEITEMLPTILDEIDQIIRLHMFEEEK